jgi:hypothetical protein
MDFFVVDAEVVPTAGNAVGNGFEGAGWVTGGDSP